MRRATRLRELLLILFLAGSAVPASATEDASLVELPATATGPVLAVVYSGDGGWQDLDKTIAEIFQAKGIPTVGVDSLKRFWTKRTPEESAAQLTGIIRDYGARWGLQRVLLVGYSFGADVLPAIYNRLAPAERDKVAEIALLGFARSTPFEIRAAGWIGLESSDALPTLPEAAKIDPGLILCVYGAEEAKDSACLDLPKGGEPGGAEVLRTEGGHHFDRNYPALADRILAGLERRLAAAGSSQAK